MSLLILLEVYLHIILEKFLTDITDKIRLAHLAGSVYLSYMYIIYMLYIFILKYNNYICIEYI